MTFDTIFTVKNEHLARLNSDEAVLFFADLLRAETRRLGLPVTSVNVSSRTRTWLTAALTLPLTPTFRKRAG